MNDFERALARELASMRERQSRDVSATVRRLIQVRRAWANLAGLSAIILVLTLAGAMAKIGLDVAGASFPSLSAASGLNELYWAPAFTISALLVWTAHLVISLLRG